MSELKFDFGVKQASTSNPKKLFIYSNYKVGKTVLVQGLEDYISLDLEGSSEFYTGRYINIQKMSEDSGKSLLHVMDEFLIALSNEIQTNRNGKKFKYMVVDTVTKLQDIANELAIKMYKKTPMGAKYNGTDITTLAHGAGWAWMQQAFVKFYNILLNFCDHLILFGHVKYASITKEGKETSTQDVNLSGKMRHIVCADSDAIGYMYRKNKNENYISFIKQSDTDLATGTRCNHLRDKEILISKKVGEGEDAQFEFYWNSIFID